MNYFIYILSETKIMVLPSRYWALISIISFVVLVAIFTRRQYQPINTSQQKTYEANKVVPVFDSGSLKATSETPNIKKNKDFPLKLSLENENVMNKQDNYQNFKNKLCELDKLRLRNLEKIDFSKQTNEQIENALQAFIMDPTDTVCKEKHRFGGDYRSFCHYLDGGKFVCMDELIYDIANNECVIFSFGIANDWTFEDTMDELGCTVYAFDPTVNFPSKRGRNITFEKLGVAAKNDTANLLDTLGTILKKYHHENRKISYLKVDIEGSELAGLPSWLSEGALKNVQQIAAEVHLRGAESSIAFFKTMQRLYFEGDYRLISYEPNGCYFNMRKKLKFYYFFEMVLKKVNQDHKVMEKNCKGLRS